MGYKSKEEGYLGQVVRHRNEELSGGISEAKKDISESKVSFTPLLLPV